MVKKTKTPLNRAAFLKSITKNVDNYYFFIVILGSPLYVGLIKSLNFFFDPVLKNDPRANLAERNG